MSTLLYTKDHEWLMITDDSATVGITDHAQKALGEIVFVELPEVGQHYEKEGAVAVVESVKSASDIYAPLEGIVSHVNEALDDAPELINDDAEAGAWFFKMTIDPSFDRSGFMSHADYLTFIEE